MPDIPPKSLRLIPRGQYLAYIPILRFLNIFWEVSQQDFIDFRWLDTVFKKNGNLQFRSVFFEITICLKTNIVLFLFKI